MRLRVGVRLRSMRTNVEPLALLPPGSGVWVGWIPATLLTIIVVLRLSLLLSVLFILLALFLGSFILLALFLGSFIKLLLSEL